MKYLEFSAFSGKVGDAFNGAFKKHESKFTLKLSGLTREVSFYLGRKKVPAGFVLKKQSKISVYIPASFMKQEYFEFDPASICYEDDGIIIVNKPAGLPSQPTLRVFEDHLYGALKAYLNKDSLSKEKYLGLQHRLDRMTSGLILMTKKTSYNKSIGDQFSERKIKKTYKARAVANKPVEATIWTVDAAIGKISETPKFKFGVTEMGKPAKTHFKVIEDLSDNHYLIECSPVTGRTHQIRVHLQHSGYGIFGDREYGVKGGCRMFLHAEKLVFTHPESTKLIEVTAPIEEDFYVKPLK